VRSVYAAAAGGFAAFGYYCVRQDVGDWIVALMLGATITCALWSRSEDR
jgi:hypothetical protein